MNETQRTPILSVVIIGRNEGERLVACIRSVLAMGHQPKEIEVIYVDSGSTDGSADRAAALGARVIVVHPERPSAALGRNAGWRAASAPFVLFLDGDTILDPDFVSKSIGEFTDGKVAVVCGRRRELRPEASVYNRVLDLDWIFPLGSVEFCGGDALIRRTVLEQVDGYDASLIAGEEPDMCRRMRALGYVILHLDLPMTGHDLAITRWSQYWKRAFRTGHAYAEIADRSRNTSTPLWEREVKRTLRNGTALLLLFSLGVVASLVLFSPLPLLASLGVLFLLATRTALKVGWKSRNPLTRFLYGVHSHVQQIPILFGLIGYWRDKHAGRKRRLIEYKETTP
jgi:cellulose synthase/poly-beta-1,6-N-acetylglucosamine synthase-like glycosyltransferase